MDMTVRDMSDMDMSGMDMSGMDMPGMGDTAEPVTPTAAADTADMTGMPDMSSDTTGSTALPSASGTLTLLAAAASETTHSEEAAVSASAAQMGSMNSMPGMSGMSSSFHFGVGDTLWTTSLTPTNGQGYTGAIFLLILMAFSLRLLSTLRGMSEKHWKPKTPSRCHDDEADNYLKMGQPQGDEANGSSGHRWNTTIQLIRAFFQLTTMTMGYLLMLAVMTFNLGYLLAILAGGFLGELALGWIQH